MTFFRTIWWFLYFFGALAGMVPAMRKAQRLKAAGDEAAAPLIQKNVAGWAAALLRIAGVRVTVTGRENIPAGQAVVFAPNHQGNYDVPLMLTQLAGPPALMAKIETKKIPLVRTWMELLDCVFIDRANPRQAVAAMHDAEKLLAAGKSIVVFPEGTRSRGPAMGEFKVGAFRMACSAGVPVVPIAIDGSYRVMEANGGWMKPAQVRMTILPPVQTAGLDRAAQKALPEKVAAQIAAALEAARTAQG